METGDKYRDVTYNISNLKDVELSVHEIYHLKALITLKQVNTSVVEKKEASVGRCKLSLYTNNSCDEDVVLFRR